MGAGIWYRRDNRRHVFVEADAVEASGWDVFCSDLRDACRATFTPRDRWESDARVVAANAMFRVSVTEDAYGCAHVLFTADPDSGLAMARLDAAAEAYFDRLARVYPLRVAVSAWTSQPRA